MAKKPRTYWTRFAMGHPAEFIADDNVHCMVRLYETKKLASNDGLHMDVRKVKIVEVK